jgi:hypothetical protein
MKRVSKRGVHGGNRVLSGKEKGQGFRRTWEGCEKAYISDSRYGQWMNIFGIFDMWQVFEGAGPPESSSRSMDAEGFRPGVLVAPWVQLGPGFSRL